jgi:hypothetical protein
MLLPKLDRKNRLVTMLLDQGCMTVVLFLLGFPVQLIYFGQIMRTRHFDPADLGGYLIYFLLIFSLYFNKDIYQGRSIAKRIIKFQVVNNKTGLAADPLRCLIRNLPILFWPVEALVAFINPERRLGDFIAGTRLAVYDEELSASRDQPDWVRICMAIALGAGFVFLFIYWPVATFARMAIEAQQPRI